MHNRNDSAEHESITTDGLPCEQCSVCGTSIDTTEWYPIRGHTSDGAFRLATFCSEACLETWESRESMETN